MERTMNFLNVVQLLAKIRAMLAIDLSAEGLREWLRSLAGLAEYLTDMTGLEWDDDLAKLLRVSVESDEVFDAFYAVVERVLKRMDDEQEVTPIPMGELRTRLVRFVSEEYNTTPGTRTSFHSPAVIAQVPSAEAAGAMPWISLIGIVVQLIGNIRNGQHN